MAPWKKQRGKGEPMKILLKLPLKNHCSVTIGLMQLSLHAVEEVSSCSESHHGYNSRRHDFWSVVLAGLLPFKNQHFGCWRASTTPTSEAWGGSGSWKQGWGCWSPPAPHLRNLNPALVSVRGMKCHSLGVLYTSYTFIFFPGDFHHIHSCQSDKLRMWKSRSCQLFLPCPKGTCGYHTYCFLCVSYLTLPCFLSLFPVR